MESGPSKAAAAGLGVNPGRKVKAAAASPFSVGRRSGSPTGLVPVRGGGVPAAPVFPSNSPSTMATSAAANSAPIGSFTVHNIAGTPSSTTGFPFPPPPSPALWASNGGTPVSPSFGHSQTTWDEDTQGLMRYFGSQPHNLVGAPSPHSNVSTPVHENNGGSSPSEQQGNHVTVNVEEEDVRIEKRILWTPKEDERLMNAWIENSTDSSTGADRKGEAYWGDVINAYNKDTPRQRRRTAKQAKDRWHKINKWCDLFESDYVKSRRVFTSGYNDEMWMEAAENFYLAHKLGPFTIKNVWKICREVAKWKTYNENLKNARKRH